MRSLTASFGVALVATAACLGTAFAQGVNDPNGAPNPYQAIDNWAQLPQGRVFGQAIGIDIDRDGKSVWVFDRCGGKTCTGSAAAPIQKFDASGKLVTSFGAGMFNFPHGLFVDRDNNIWVSDGKSANGSGHTIIKFSADGKVLMTLGTPGVAGTDEHHFNAPSDVLVAPNGDIFVADGHGGDTNARIVHFSKDGKFVKSWGKKGSSPGEFDIPHAIAIDSQGRLFVGDRNNNRIQIFDQDGKFLAEWKQFSRSSGVFIDKNDIIYVADSESESVRNSNPGWKRGFRVGSARTGEVTALIPDPVEKATGTSAAEGVATDAMGNIYGAEVGPKRLMKYVKN